MATIIRKTKRLYRVFEIAAGSPRERGTFAAVTPVEAVQVAIKVLANSGSAAAAQADRQA
jgi:hypothetical protein